MEPITFEWDAGKAESNLDKHGVAFDQIDHMDFDTAIVVPDRRKNYGEERFLAYGFIHARLHVLAFTWRDEAIRCISLRKANQRELRNYEKALGE